MEWTVVKPDGSEVLLNSADDVAALKTFRAVTPPPQNRNAGGMGVLLGPTNVCACSRSISLSPMIVAGVQKPPATSAGTSLARHAAAWDSILAVDP
jgi:hypothetical protein